MVDVADVDEDVIPPPPPPNDPSAELDEEIQDFRFLSTLSQSTPSLPRRGIKDFEPDRTMSQHSALESSRAAMHAALSGSRLQSPKAVLRATYSSAMGRVRVQHPRGTHFRTMGAAVKKKGDVDGGGAGVGEGEGGGTGAVMLKEEEALYLVERGALELRFEGRRGEDDNQGAGKGSVQEEEEEGEKEEVAGNMKEGGNGRNEELGLPMSVQAAYTFLIGAGHGLTLERFIVYSGLKRSGYIVLRAPGWDGEGEHGGDGAGGDKKEKEESRDGVQIQQPPLGWFSRIYKALWESLALGGQWHHYGPGAGPLVGLGVYRSYNDVYRLLSIIPTYDPTTLQLEPANPNATAITTDQPKSNILQQHEYPPSQGPYHEPPPPPPPLRPCFHVWKPHLNFKKSSPATPPDFYIAVLNARQESTFPTLSQLDSLLRIVPPDPPFQPPGDGAKQGEGGGQGGGAKTQRQYQSRLKHGWRNVIVAVVDEGVVSYIRIGEGAFGKEKLFELEGREGGGGGGGKRGGGGRGRGRGRGRRRAGRGGG